MTFEQNVHDDCARPDVNGLTVRWLRENLRGHVEKSAALGLDAFGVAGVDLGAESKIGDFDCGEVTSLSH